MPRIVALLVQIAFALSMALTLLLAFSDPSWWMIPAALAGWYLADLLSGVVHMTMDYRPCVPDRGLDRLYFYEGSRESDEYQALFKATMKTLNPFERIVYDFKNHHPRPHALGRRTMWRQIGSSVLAGALPLSLLLNLAWLLLGVPGWAMAGAAALILGTAFAQYFHGTLHQERPALPVRLLRRLGLLMTPEAHQLHHDTLQRDFSTNCGWSNPLLNAYFRTRRAQGAFTDDGLEPTS